MEKQVKTKKDLLAESQKEQELEKLFSLCLHLMDEAYRKKHQIKLMH